ncbi:MAG TPA: hypothetical protein VFE48_18465 [Methylomirabilota bacterium]|nr:hypothetical protein [Methylomirabilota bacterium]
MSRPRSLAFWSAVLLVGLLVLLRPMAWAEPVDPSWIAGYYDGGDFDEVVSAIASSSAIAGAPASLPQALPRVPDRPAEHRGEVPPPHSRPSLLTRAPPPPFAPTV